MSARTLSAPRLRAHIKGLLKLAYRYKNCTMEIAPRGKDVYYCKPKRIARLHEGVKSALLGATAIVLFMASSQPLREFGEASFGNTPALKRKEEM